MNKKIFKVLASFMAIMTIAQSLQAFASSASMDPSFDTKTPV
jgi:hypothetical protein